jgi:hypothetical protein
VAKNYRLPNTYLYRVIHLRVFSQNQIIQPRLEASYTAIAGHLVHVGEPMADVEATLTRKKYTLSSPRAGYKPGTQEIIASYPPEYHPLFPLILFLNFDAKGKLISYSAQCDDEWI